MEKLIRIHIKWSRNSMSLSTAGNNEKIVVENNLNADVYNIQIIDSNGCSSTIQTVI